MGHQVASGESKSIERMRKKPQHTSKIFTYPFHRSKLYTSNLTVKRYLFNPYKSNDNELVNATALIKAKRGACNTTLLQFYTSTHFLLDLFVCLFGFLAQTIDTIPVTEVFLLLAGTLATKMGTFLTMQGINSVRLHYQLKVTVFTCRIIRGNPKSIAIFLVQVFLSHNRFQDITNDSESSNARSQNGKYSA